MRRTVGVGAEQDDPVGVEFLGDGARVAWITRMGMFAPWYIRFGGTERETGLAG